MGNWPAPEVLGSAGKNVMHEASLIGAMVAITVLNAALNFMLDLLADGRISGLIRASLAAAALMASFACRLRAVGALIYPTDIAARITHRLDRIIYHRHAVLAKLNDESAVRNLPHVAFIHVAGHLVDQSDRRRGTVSWCSERYGRLDQAAISVPRRPRQRLNAANTRKVVLAP